MRHDADHQVSFCLQAALLLTTRPMRSYASVMGPPLSQGWKMRAASLRWFTVWRNHTDALRRLRAIVLPEPWKNDTWAWEALRLRQLYALGIVDEEPEAWTQMLAERLLFDRLASPWGDALSGEKR
jgi:hypothetical protein